MIEALLSQLWVQRLGWTLLHFLWQGTAIAVLYATLRATLGRVLSARGRYLLACLGLTAMAVAPPLTFFLLPHGGEGLSGRLTLVPWNLSFSAWHRLLPGFVAFWMAGVLAFSIRLFGGWRFTARLRSTSHPAPPEWQQALERISAQVGAMLSRAERPVRLLVSSLVDVPTVVGWLRPAILIPVEALTGLPSDYLTALLAHEVAHIYRRDYVASVLQSVVEAVLFYHPAVWWVSEQMRAERESCCDDLAVAASGDLRTYVCALAELESQQAPRLKTVLAANGGSLVNRIQRLIEPAQPVAESLPAAGSAWAMTLLLLAGAGVATLHAAPTAVANTHPTAAATPSATYPAITPAVPLSPFPALPEPSTSLTHHARNAVLFDPFLSAQVVQSPRPGDTPAAGNGGALGSQWQKWLDEDVVYIISAEERSAFLRLNTDEERAAFADQFWLRRDPTPGTAENENKEEHYRRIAYANQHFGSGTQGWKTDRGRVYITLGPPDEIESHAAGVQPYPMETWRYRSVSGQGNNVPIQFADTANTGEYRIVQGQPGVDQSMNEFQRMQQFFRSQPTPQLQFPDLAAAVDTRIVGNRLPMKVQIDYLQGTGSSAMVNVTVQFENHDLQFQPQNGVDKAVVNVFGRITSMTRRPVSTFEPTLEVDLPPGTTPKFARRIYQQSVPLPSGRYHLNVVAKDAVSGNTNVYEAALDVPHFDEGKLGASSLILADALEQVPAKQTGSGMFAIGDTKVRPRVDGSFPGSEKMGVYLQVYNFAPGEKTQNPTGSIEYEIDNADSAAKIMDFSEDIAGVANASASQVTIRKLLPLTSFAPGAYILRVTVTDRKANQTVQRRANFKVTPE